MTIPETVNERRTALRAWRRERMQANESVPSMEDISRLAAMAPQDVAAIAGMPSTQRALLVSLADEILGVLWGREKPAGALGSETTEPAIHSARPAEPAERAASSAPVAWPGHATVPGPGPGPGDPPPAPRRPAEAPVADVSSLTFVAYDPLAAASGLLPGPISPEIDEAGLTYSWTAGSGGAAKVTIARVRAHDTYSPGSPDGGRLVGVTTDSRIVDPAPMTTPFRYVEVWVHSGADAHEAAATQPRLVARDFVVAPVTDVTMGYESGQVSGAWRVPPELRVDVYQVPMDEVDSLGLPRSNPIARDAGTGVQHTDVQPGATYEYRIYTVGTTPDGIARYSAPVRHRLTIATPLAGVGDLDHTLSDDGRWITLSWAPPPVGDVHVYLSVKRPAAGLADQEVAVADLPRAGLAEADDLATRGHQSTLEGGRLRVRQIPFPPETTRAFLTPVTVHQGRARAGATVSVLQLAEATGLRLFQRVDNQQLTFGWPGGWTDERGAAKVYIYETVPGDSWSEGSPPSAVIEKETYRTEGGARLRLRSKGSDVHVVPVVYEDFKKYLGRGRSVSYPGLLVIRYRFERLGGKARGTARLFATADSDVKDLQFVVALRNDRLPLAPGEGASDGTVSVREVVMPPAWLPQNQEVAVGEPFQVGERFMRAFHRTDTPDVIALLDPEVDQLWIAR